MKEIVLKVPEPLFNALRAVKMALFGKSRVKINLLGDRHIENSFIISRIDGHAGRALDFGCSGSYMGLYAAMKGYEVTGIDLNSEGMPWIHKNFKYIEGDFLQTDFDINTFDLIINCSAVEHVGLSGRYGVNESADSGDIDAMNKMLKVLKPGGMMLLTIPVGKDSVFPPYCRVYGEKRLPKLLDGYRITEEIFYTKKEELGNKWIITSKEDALASTPYMRSVNPGKNFCSLGCFALKK